jgi:hypothetical protein
VPKRKRKKPEGPGDQTLAVVLGATLSGALTVMGVLPMAEAYLAGFTVGSLVGYWIPPRPPISYLRWIVTQGAMVLGGYLALFKIPVALKPVMPVALAYGIPITLLVLGVVARFTFLRRQARC